MAFHNDRFPTNVSWESRSGPGFRTNVIKVESGLEQRVGRWEFPLWRFNMAYGIKSYTDLAAVARHYLARRGALNTFPVQDPLDFHSNPTDPTWEAAAGVRDQNIGTGDGVTTTFQLRKTYTSGPTSLIRKITKPLATTVKIWVDGVLKTEGVDYTVDLITGVVTMVVAPAAGKLVDASFQFDVVGRYGEEVDDWLAVSADTFGDGSIDSIPVYEVRDDGAGLSEEYWAGGSKQISSALTFSISSAIARVWLVSMTAAGQSVVLGDPAAEPDGSELFRILNGGANSFTVKDHLANTLVSLAANQGCEILLSKNGGGKVWLAI